MAKTWKLQLRDADDKKLQFGLRLFYSLTDRERKVLVLAHSYGGDNLFSLKNKRRIQREMAYKNVTGVTAVVNVIKQKGAIEFKQNPRRYELSRTMQVYMQADKHVFEWEKVLLKNS